MIKTHKLQDGDVIKILPTIGENDNIYWLKMYYYTFINGNSIYDDERYLWRISYKLRESNLSSILPVQIRYAMNIYINGEIRILNVSENLRKIISREYKLLDIKGDHHLFIVDKKVDVGTGHIFSSWNESYVSEKSWTPPVIDINSKEEWHSYIKENQPDFTNYLKKNNIFNQKQLLINLLGKDMLSELISDDRQKKLDKILI